jgi:hypothetical protein
MLILHEPLQRQLFFGAILIGATVLIHAIGQQTIERCLRGVLPVMQGYSARYWKLPIVIFLILGILGTIWLEISVWALFFYYFSQEAILHSLEAAAYFSICSFTTVGFGDITLTSKWRLLGGFEAAIGMLIFGWSTAFLFEMKALFPKQ